MVAAARARSAAADDCTRWLLPRADPPTPPSLEREEEKDVEVVIVVCVPSPAWPGASLGEGESDRGEDVGDDDFDSIPPPPALPALEV
jgi:hypothetical protein